MRPREVFSSAPLLSCFGGCFYPPSCLGSAARGKSARIAEGAGQRQGHLWTSISVEAGVWFSLDCCWHGIFGPFDGVSIMLGPTGSSRMRSSSRRSLGEDKYREFRRKESDRRSAKGKVRGPGKGRKIRDMRQKFVESEKQEREMCKFLGCSARSLPLPFSHLVTEIW